MTPSATSVRTPANASAPLTPSEADELACVAAWLDALKIARTHLVGHSMGGLLARSALHFGAQAGHPQAGHQAGRRR